jgi:hypothetical protein
LPDGSEEFRNVEYDALIAQAEQRDAEATPLNILTPEDVASFEAAQYQRDRATAYPSIVDQLDTLYHGGYDAWRAEIQAIKEQFPKPEVAE